jgi:hypothetical protein
LCFVLALADVTGTAVKYSAIAAGGEHVLAIVRTTGKAVVFQLAAPEKNWNNKGTAPTTALASGVRAVAASAAQSAAILSNGSVVSDQENCW